MLYLHASFKLFRSAFETFVVAGLRVTKARIAGVVDLDRRMINAELSADLMSGEKRRLGVGSLRRNRNGENEKKLAKERTEVTVK